MGRHEVGELPGDGRAADAAFTVILVRVESNGNPAAVDPAEPALPVGDDALITALASRVRHLAPTGTDLVRSDRGEFAVLLPRTPTVIAEQFAGIIRKQATRGTALSDVGGRPMTVRTAVANHPRTGVPRTLDSLLDVARARLRGESPATAPASQTPTPAADRTGPLPGGEPHPSDGRAPLHSGPPHAGSALGETPAGEAVLPSGIGATAPSAGPAPTDSDSTVPDRAAGDRIVPTGAVEYRIVADGTARASAIPAGTVQDSAVPDDSAPDATPDATPDDSAPDAAPDDAASRRGKASTPRAPEPHRPSRRERRATEITPADANEVLSRFGIRAAGGRRRRARDDDLDLYLSVGPAIPAQPPTPDSPPPPDEIPPIPPGPDQPPADPAT
ncbi:hypothetical protein ACFPM7_18855, partial [Actinokineospora guangxiensis]